MAIRADTYALARPIPFLLLQQAATQDIEFPIRHGSAGALVEPSAGTVTIKRPDGSTFSTGALVTASSPDTYSVPDTSGEDVGRRWDVILDATISSVAYKYRRQAFLCEYVPANPVSVLDMYNRVPELEGRIPQRQQANGTGEGWQTQIDIAWQEFLRELIADARPIWRLVSADDYHDRILLRACELAVKTIPANQGSSWDSDKRMLWSEAQSAKARVRLEYDDDAGERGSGTAPIRTVPPGRPLW